MTKDELKAWDLFAAHALGGAVASLREGESYGAGAAEAEAAERADRLLMHRRPRAASVVPDAPPAPKGKPEGPEPCPSRWSVEGVPKRCALVKGHDGQHRAGGLTWDGEA